MNIEIVMSMSPLDWLIFWFAVGAHVPLITGIIKTKKDKSQIFPTWFLYFTLDLITMLSTIEKDGNYVILFGFSVGSFIMAFILLYQKRIDWKWTETLTTLLVIICILAWYYCGPLWAVIFGICSEAIVGIHLIYKTFKNPRIKYNLFGYIMFLIVSILTLINAKDLSIPQIGYALCETILNVVILIPLFNKWINLRKKAQNF